MTLTDYEDNVFAEDDVFETIEENEAFREFVGKCLSHFLHFVIPRRDQTQEICQDYEIPESIPDIPGSSLMLTRSEGNRIVISFNIW